MNRVCPSPREPARRVLAGNAANPSSVGVNIVQKPTLVVMPSNDRSTCWTETVCMTKGSARTTSDVVQFISKAVAVRPAWASAVSGTGRRGISRRPPR